MQTQKGFQALLSKNRTALTLTEGGGWAPSPIFFFFFNAVAPHVTSQPRMRAPLLLPPKGNLGFAIEQDQPVPKSKEAAKGKRLRLTGCNKEPRVTRPNV